MVHWLSVRALRAKYSLYYKTEFTFYNKARPFLRENYYLLTGRLLWFRCASYLGVVYATSGFIKLSISTRPQTSLLFPGLAAKNCLNPNVFKIKINFFIPNSFARLKGRTDHGDLKPFYRAYPACTLKLFK